MTTCNGCGDCCDPVWLAGDTWLRVLEDLANGWADRDCPNQANLRFIQEHWNAVELLPDGTRVRCDRFDPDTRRCLAYDERPPVCTGFPWYGCEPTARAPLSPRCSYWADLPTEDRPPGWVPVELEGTHG